MFQRSIIVAALVFVCVAQTAVPQRIQRPKPSKTAARVGGAIPWVDSLDAALAAAKERRLPIFWYVPTVPRSPMDRKPVLDFYMRAGFFSDPQVIGALSKAFVCLRLEPDAKTAKRFELVPYKFVEPGFVVLNAQGEIVQREHSITTFQTKWLLDRLGVVPSIHPELAADERLRAGDLDGASTSLEGVDSTYARFLRGVVTWLRGDHDDARAQWRKLAADHPDDPQGWRAAAEAEGFGPFARGFWIYRAPPGGGTGDTGPGTRRTFKADERPTLISRSIAFLRSRLAKDGGYEDSNYDFGGRDSLPNVWVATTAIVGRALWRHRASDPATVRVVAATVRYVLDEKNTNPKDRNEWIWARAYTMLLLADLLHSGEERPAGTDRTTLQSRFQAMVTETVGRQRDDGSFRHEYYNPFATAIVLVALNRAKEAGLDVPAANVERALASLERARTKRGAFTYGQPRGKRPARASINAAAGRMPLCETALALWGRSDPARIDGALAAAFEHHGELERARRYDDHTRPLAYGGFFFWFDLEGREFALEYLDRAKHANVTARRTMQLATIVSIAEIDGCFVDSHELGRIYGTAMALNCLTPLVR